MIAKKGNKVIQVDEVTKARYLNDGYNIIENGKIIEYGRGATVALADYMKVVEENESLKKELSALKTKKTEKTEKSKKEE